MLLISERQVQLQGGSRVNSARSSVHQCLSSRTFVLLFYFLLHEDEDVESWSIFWSRRVSALCLFAVRGHEQLQDASSKLLRHLVFASPNIMASFPDLLNQNGDRDFNGNSRRLGR